MHSCFDTSNIFIAKIYKYGVKSEFNTRFYYIAIIKDGDKYVNFFNRNIVIPYEVGITLKDDDGWFHTIVSFESLKKYTDKEAVEYSDVDNILKNMFNKKKK